MKKDKSSTKIRLIKLFILLTSIAIIAFLSIITLFHKEILQKTISYYLNSKGIHPHNFHISSIINPGLIIENISLGDTEKLRVKKISVLYSIQNSFSLNIKNLSIEGLSLNGRLDNNNRIDFGPLISKFTTTSSSANDRSNTSTFNNIELLLSSLPIEQITITESLLNISVLDGQIKVPLNFQFINRPEKRQINYKNKLTFRGRLKINNIVEIHNTDFVLDLKILLNNNKIEVVGQKLLLDSGAPAHVNQAPAKMMVIKKINLIAKPQSILTIVFGHQRPYITEARLKLNIHDIRLLKSELPPFIANIGSIIIQFPEGNLSSLKDSKLDIDLQGGNLDIPDHKISLSDINIKSNFTIAKIMSSLNTTYSISSIKNPYTIALKIDGKIWSKDNNLQLHSEIFDKDKILYLNINSSFNHSKSSGELSFNLKPMQFAPIDLQPQAIFPFIKDMIKETGGELSLSGKLKIKNKKIDPLIKLKINDFSTTYQKMRISKLSSIISFNQLSPLTTDDWQTIKVDEINSSVKMQNIVVPFRLTSQESLELRNAKIDLMGGNISLAEKLSLHLPSQKISDFAINIQKIKLHQALSLALKEQIKAQGDLSGHIPFKNINNKILIKQGNIQSNQQGIIRYSPKKETPLASSQNQNVNILLKYLANFYYDKLNISINSNKKYDFAMVLDAFGKNPLLTSETALGKNMVFDGRKPLKFQMTLSGNIVKMLKSELRGLELHKNIEKNLFRRQRQ